MASRLSSQRMTFLDLVLSFPFLPLNACMCYVLYPSMNTRPLFCNSITCTYAPPNWNSFAVSFQAILLISLLCLCFGAVLLNIFTTYTFLGRCQPHAGQNHDTKIANRSTANVAWFKYSGRTVRNQDLIQEEIKRRLNSGNACYNSVQNLLSSCKLSKHKN
jgi:hypothetical protein